MDIKNILICSLGISLIGIVCAEYTCYSCTYSEYHGSYNSSSGNERCKDSRCIDVYDVDTVQDCEFGCGKSVLRYRITLPGGEHTYFTSHKRGCAGHDEYGCTDHAYFRTLTRFTFEDTVKLNFDDTFDIVPKDVNLFDGDLCGCDEDKCNKAPAKNQSRVVLLISTLIGLAMVAFRLDF